MDSIDPEVYLADVLPRFAARPVHWLEDCWFGMGGQHQRSLLAWQGLTLNKVHHVTQIRKTSVYGIGENGVEAFIDRRGTKL
ncbi:hypothetical protein [Bradyrhizobium sp. USDA 4353]